MILNIVPLIGVSDFKFKQTREHIQQNILLPINRTMEQTIDNNSMIIDDYGVFATYYNKSDNRLFYMTFTSDIYLYGTNLFKLCAEEVYQLLKSKDNNLYSEDYVGFGSIKLGVDIYCPDFTEDKTATIVGLRNGADTLGVRKIQGRTD